MVIRELRVLGHALREIDTDAEANRPHVAIAQHGRAGIDAPHFGIGEPLFQRDGQLTDAAPHVENAANLAILR